MNILIELGLAILGLIMLIISIYFMLSVASSLKDISRNQEYIAECIKWLKTQK